MLAEGMEGYIVDKYVAGTCHASIQLISQFDDGDLPSQLTPIRRRVPLKMDSATNSQIDSDAERVAFCVEDLGQPGGWTFGDNSGLGVFLWSSESDISKKYRQLKSSDESEPVLVEIA